MRWSPPPEERVTLVGCFLFWRAIMQDVTLVGIDLGKHSFHLHGQDRHEHHGSTTARFIVLPEQTAQEPGL